jgi:hypothetical protein
MIHSHAKRIWAGVTILLLGSLMGVAMQGPVQAAQAGTPNTSTPTDTPTLTSTTTQTSNPNITSTPSAPAHVVISEFRTRGPNGVNDEFVELFNPTGAPVNIGNWLIRQSSGCASVITNQVTIPANTILLAGQHYLTAASNSSSVTGADQVFTPGLVDNGGIALINLSGLIVDQVGMCISTLYHEGMNLEPLLTDENRSYERRQGGATACYDTDNNGGDFLLNEPSQPQNKTDPIAMCPGVPVFTPTFTPTRTYTRTPTFTSTTVPGSVVINEFLPHPESDWNDDGTPNVGDEYIEVMNMGASSINIQNWKLDNGAGTGAFNLPDYVMLSHEILVFYHSQTGIRLSDGGGTVRLLKSDGNTADIYNYPPVEAADKTWCRLPDGNGGWDFVCQPSPGRPNELLSPVLPTATITPITGTANGCVLGGSIPAEVASVECNDFGAGIWHPVPDGAYWLPGSRKWAVYVE